MKKYWRDNLTGYLMSAFLFLALLNPLFKKYDYGGGWPMVVLAGVGVFIIAVMEFSRRREAALLEKVSIVGFLAAVALSFLFSLTKNVGFSEVMAYFIAMTTYLILAHQNVKFRQSFIRSIALLTIISVIVGFLIYVMHPQNRMFGPFFNLLERSNVWPNAFALYLLITWPLFLMISSEKKLKFNLKIVFLLSAVIAGLLLTFSRGALIAFIGQMVLLGIYFFRKINFKSVGKILAGIASVIVIFNVVNAVRGAGYDVIDVEKRASFETDNDAQTSKQERVDFWMGAIEMVKEKPLLGWGPFSFRQVYNPMQRGLLANSDHPHNIFLKIAAENGLIALGFFALFLLGILVKIATRWKKLDGGTRDRVFLLSVAVAGAFAHNLIDYNLNFIVNLLLLFIWMAFIRSMLVDEKKTKARPPVVSTLLTFIILLFALYEGWITFLDYGLKQHDIVAYSVFPRNYYLTEADSLLNSGDIEGFREAADKHLSLNRLDSQGHYLRGVYFCRESSPEYDLEKCRSDFALALELNPYNDWNYYRDYASVLIRLGDFDSLKSFMDTTLPLLDQYFVDVKNNVHFTGYTANVESAEGTIDVLLPYMDEEQQKYFTFKRDQMMRNAYNLRGHKTY